MDFLMDDKKEYRGFLVKKSFKENIEPEEVLLDAQKIIDFPEQKLETPLKARVFLLFFSIILFGLSALAVRAGYYQFFKNSTYLTLSQRNSLRAYPVAAPRGLIYDRNLKPLVNNLPGSNVFLTPQDLPKDAFLRDDMIERISYLLDLDPKDINQMLAEFNFEKAQRILLVSDLTPEKSLELESRLTDFPALSIENGVIRQYSYGQMFSHILGYTGRLSKEDLQSFQNYELTDRIGKSGLEAQYEQYLKGQAGQHQMEVNAAGRQIQDLGVKEPIAGQNLVTTLDFGLQQEMFGDLAKMLESLKGVKAVAVAMDPRNGQILGLVSLPSFDNNVFEKNNQAADFEGLWSDINQPLFDRAVAGQYPSGSTIKPLIGSAALQEGVVTPTTTIYDTGEIVIGNQFNPSIVYRFPDWKAHGTVNIYSAIAQSCDVYFYTVGGGYGDISGLGIDKIDKYLQLFGLGQITGVDLPGEQAGLVPSPDWKQKTKNEGWYIGDTYHVSIGQGDLLVTPLQMTASIASIANGGKLYTPYLVDKIVDSDKNSIKVLTPQIKRDNFIKPDILNTIRQGMRQAVTEGSVRQLADLPVKAAGKTGTAQVAGQKEDAWFVGFAPYDNPQIVLTILFEDAGEGSSFAVPVAKEVLNYYFTRN